MISKEMFNKLTEYDRLPSTPEKDELDRQYLNDEISAIDWQLAAYRYIDKVEKEISRD